MTSSSASRRLAASAVRVEGLLGALLESSEDAIVTQDAGWRITSWNQAAERFFGYAADEVLGLVCTDLFADHLRGDMENAFGTVMAGDRVSHLETEILRVGGLPVPISVTLCPIYDDTREPVASLLIARDITEQRLAQATLAEIEARVRDSEALANVGSWLWDLRTGAVQWSDEFHRIHGVDPREFDGTLDAHLRTIHTRDRTAVRAGMERSVESVRPFDHEYRVLRPDDEMRLVRVRAEPMIGSDGAVVGLRGIGQDVTDQS